MEGLLVPFRAGSAAAAMMVMLMARRPEGRALWEGDVG